MPSSADWADVHQEIGAPLRIATLYPVAAATPGVVDVLELQAVALQ